MINSEERYRQAFAHIAEIKRILCATEYALKDQRPATVLVTSAAPGEGKSLFVAALATAAAQSGKYRVAALDLNWDRPALHRFFNLALTHSEKALCAAELSALVCPSGQDSLDILTAPGDYADCFKGDTHAGAVTARLIGQARTAYDVVIIDSAAIFPASEMMIDPVMLSGLADGVVMVVLTAATPRQQIRRAQKIMESSGASILGVISNQRKLSAP